MYGAEVLDLISYRRGGWWAAFYTKYLHDALPTLEALAQTHSSAPPLSAVRRWMGYNLNLVIEMGHQRVMSINEVIDEDGVLTLRPIFEHDGDELKATEARLSNKLHQRLHEVGFDAAHPL